MSLPLDGVIARYGGALRKSLPSVRLGRADADICISGALLAPEIQASWIANQKEVCLANHMLGRAFDRGARCQQRENSNNHCVYSHERCRSRMPNQWIDILICMLLWDKALWINRLVALFSLGVYQGPLAEFEGSIHINRQAFKLDCKAATLKLSSELDTHYLPIDPNRKLNTTAEARKASR